MSHEDVGGACLARHGSRAFARECSFRLGRDVLRADSDFRALFQRHRHRLDGDDRRTENDGAPSVPGIQAQELGDELAGRARPVMHLPVCDEDRLLHYRRSSRAATPGSSLPSRNSSDAPPPVDTWLILSSRFASATAAAESPPPTTVIAPLSVAAAIASAMARVPLSNGGVSNTPIGPFHTTVIALAMTCAKAATDAGPMSNIAMSAGILSRGTT